MFELSKVERTDIRSRIVAGLRNVDEDLAGAVAAGLGAELPEKTSPAREPISDLPVSLALSILENGPQHLVGRKLGVLVTDGADSGLLEQLRSSAKAERVVVEIVAATVGGVTGSDGEVIPADQKIDGGPSVLDDAVVILASPDAVPALLGHPAARDFVTDAYAHAKFVGYTSAASTLFDGVGLPEDLDPGFLDLDDVGVDGFLDACAPLRYWDTRRADGVRNHETTPSTSRTPGRSAPISSPANEDGRHDPEPPDGGDSDRIPQHPTGQEQAQINRAVDPPA